MGYSQVWIEEIYHVKCNDTTWTFDNRADAVKKANELRGVKPKVRKKKVK